MFRKLIFVSSLIFVLSLVSGVPAQDVVIPSPGTMPKLDGNIDEVWFFSTEQAIDTSKVGSAPSSPEDCSGTWRALWNSEALYVLTIINDEDLLNDTPFSVDYQAGVIRWGNHPAHSTQYHIKTKAIIKGVRVLLPVDIVYKGQTFSKLFVLDTGAAQTSVTPMFARILGVTNVSQGRWVKISWIKAGPLELKDHRIAIWDAPDNLIGMDLLQYVNFTIDYRAGVIRWNL